MWKYFRSKGRVNRLELSFLSLIAIVLFITIWNLMEHDSNSFIFSCIVLFLFYTFQVSKRYHDLNMWGINAYFWFIIPIANIYFFIQLYFFKGSEGANVYGETSDFNLRTIFPKRKSKVKIVQERPNEIKSYERITTKSKQENFNYDFRKVPLSFEKVETNSKVGFKLKNANSYYLSEWYVEEGDYINEGQPLFVYKNSKEQSTMNSPSSGFIELLFKPSETKSISSYYYIFALYNDDNVRLSNRYTNHSQILRDEFTKNLSLFWEKVAVPQDEKSNYYLDFNKKLFLEEKYIKLNENIGISIENVECRDYFTIYFNSSNIRLRENDEILFLFENESVLNIKIEGKPFKDNDITKGYRIPILYEEIELIATLNIIKIRIKQSIDNYQFDIEKAHEWYNSKKDFQFVIRNLFSEYLELVNTKIDNYAPLFKSSLNENETKTNLNDSCFIYLMHDTTNDFYKIGISNNPDYRERTLQSEKPTIELICSKVYPNRKIAMSFEKALHKAFKDKHIRGEWFNLDDNELNQLKETLS